MKSILLRVGIDKGTDGCLAPIFEDQSFEYIPLSETANTAEDRTYAHFIGRKGKHLATYLPLKVKNHRMHFDPEFETFTYGDKGAKAKWLLKLNHGDLLVFYAGLTPYKHDSSPEALYIIAYFTVTEIVNFDDLSFEENELYCKKCSNNAHVKRHDDLEGTVIVMGHENKSKLLDKAIIISEPRLNKIGRKYHAASKEMEDLIGIKGSIQRSIPPRMIEDKKYLKNLLKLLEISK
ncbi:MAG: Nmad3 family putative nucleotide modification protein [Methanobacterium sp.]